MLKELQSGQLSPQGIGGEEQLIVDLIKYFQSHEE
jgi:hypothetical protein